MDFQKVKVIAGFSGVTAINLGGAQVALLECKSLLALVVRHGVATASYIDLAGRPVLREPLKSYSQEEALAKHF